MNPNYFMAIHLAAKNQHIGSYTGAIFAMAYAQRS